MEDQKDNRHKYLELPAAYQSKAVEINLWVKQSQRTCERLAQHLSKSNPKTPEEFERVEFLKDFVLKTSQSNEKVLDLLQYLTKFLNEVMADADTLQQGAVIREQMIMQSEHLIDLNNQNEILLGLIEHLHDLSGKDKTAN